MTYMTNMTCTLVCTSENVTCKLSERSSCPTQPCKPQEGLTRQPECNVEKNVTQEERTGIPLEQGKSERRHENIHEVLERKKGISSSYMLRPG